MRMRGSARPALIIIAAGIAVRRSGASLPAAALAGLLAGEGPDLDVFIRSAVTATLAAKLLKELASFSQVNKPDF